MALAINTLAFSLIVKIVSDKMRPCFLVTCLWRFADFTIDEPGGEFSSEVFHAVTVGSVVTA
jgi:hypothetical protein